MSNNNESSLRVGVNMATELPGVPTVNLDFFFLWNPQWCANVGKQCGLHQHRPLTRKEEMCGPTTSGGTDPLAWSAAVVGRHRGSKRNRYERKDGVNSGQREFCWLHSFKFIVIYFIAIHTSLPVMKLFVTEPHSLTVKQRRHWGYRLVNVYATTQYTGLMVPPSSKTSPSRLLAYIWHNIQPCVTVLQ